MCCTRATASISIMRILIYAHAEQWVWQRESKLYLWINEVQGSAARFPNCMFLTVGVEIVFWLLAVWVVTLGWLVVLLVLQPDKVAMSDRIYASFVLHIWCASIDIAWFVCYIQASAVQKNTFYTWCVTLYPELKANIEILQRTVLLYRVN